MKTNPIASRFPRQKSGMALISVLAVLFLLTLLVVAFMARTTGARAASANYRATASTKALADTAINLVQAQINEATSEGIDANDIGTETWASQPGAIRVFATATGSQGQLNRVYRLYSATPTNPSTMRYIDEGTATSDAAANTDALSALAADLPNASSWTQYGAQWCDLNSYARDSEGKYHFPILDPRDPGAPDPTVDPGTVGTLWAPISSVPALHGISINAPGAVLTTSNPAPMPVRWLYILKDGSIVSPDAPGTPSNQLTFLNATNVLGTNAAVVSAANPIVGRIAFWTDDESSKININTAAGDDVLRNNIAGPNPSASTSSFWATPTFSTQDEWDLAYFQPLNGEIQRYPGHPGAVGLNTTLSTLAGLSTPLPYADFFSLTPRYTGGGSMSATQPVDYQGSNSVPSVTLTANRLYTSIGEMLYKVDRTASALTTDAGTEARATAAVERSSFFLTAHSSSAELTLSGTPRVCIWPVSNKLPASTYQTPIDQLIMFDSTIPQTNAGTPDLFYFQRNDPTSSVTDAAIANNKSLLTYLDKLTSRTNGGATSSIPGFGSDFAGDKYKNTKTPPATRQILAEIFDYIRTVNVIDPVMRVKSATGLGHNYTYAQNWGDNSAAVVNGSNTGGIGNTTNYRGAMGGIQVVPSSNVSGISGGNWGCHGIGAFPIPVEIAIDFAALGTGALPKKGLFPATPEKTIPAGQFGFATVAHDTVLEGVVNPTAASPTNAGWDNITPELSPPDGTGKPSDQSTAMQAFVFVAFLNPGQITASIQPCFAYSVTGLNSLSVSGYLTNSISSYPPNPPGAPPPNYQTIPPAPPGNMTVWPAGIQTAHPVYLHFPGNTANTAGWVYNSTTLAASLSPSATIAGSNSDEEFVVNDNSVCSGYMNGDVGDWIFGYIPFIGEVGITQYGFSTCYLGPCPVGRTWNNSASYGYNARSFPLYSQIFGLPGVQGWSSANGSINAQTVTTVGAASTAANKALFQFNGNDTGTFVTLKMYDANHDTQVVSATDVVSTYQFRFPASANPLLLPTFAASDSQIIGTGPSGPYPNTGLASLNGRVTTDRWHQDYSYPTSPGTIYGTMIAQNDTVQSLVLSAAWSDVRDLALAQVGSSGVSAFGPHPLYGQRVALNAATFTSMAHDLYLDSGHPFAGNLDATNWGRLVTQTVGSSNGYTPAAPDHISFVGTHNYPWVPPLLLGPNGSPGTAGQGAYTTTGAPGDWDNGVAAHLDGPWINMPDEGALMNTNNGNNGSGVMNGGTTAYYSTGNNGQRTGTSSSFSPNRQMPSPGMFGSQPTGVNSTSPQPWQTLLFRPGSGAGGFGQFHPGEKDRSSVGSAPGDPADHMILDLFWMPEVEPYPISSPFATEGKINLNYEIQPFTYITRDTALRALFSSEEIAVMPDVLASGYKQPWNANAPAALASSSIKSSTSGMDVNGNSRLPIDPDATLGLNPTTTADPHAPASGTGQSGSTAWYDSTKNTTRFFKSASELCEMFLVPQGYNWKEFSGVTFDSHSWYKIPGGDFALVGDNTREKPYTDLYSRVTTKSNTFTVYYTVQALKNAQPQTDSSQQRWDENLGNVVGEYRGSTTLERYLDPNQTLPDYLNAGAPLDSLEPYYRWRIVAVRQFAP